MIWESGNERTVSDDRIQSSDAWTTPELTACFPFLWFLFVPEVQSRSMKKISRFRRNDRSFLADF